jgi:regulatory protein
MEAQKQNYSSKEAFQLILRYCAYQERSHKEVKWRLHRYGVTDVEEAGEMISRLITEGYLSESRYSMAIAGGKHRMQHWGKNKIIQKLKSEGVSATNISDGLKEIDTESYLHTLRILAEKKILQYEPKSKNKYQLSQKTAAYLISKGYEPDLVWATLEPMLHHKPE